MKRTDWIAYLFRWDQRPRIPHHLVNPFEINQASEDELLIYMAGKARDRHYIERLKRKYKAKNAVELLDRLPKPKRTPLFQRMRSLIARWEGALPYDPMRREMHEIRRDAARTKVQGIRHSKLHDWR
jgi:hypothetical protein